jgi:hypothetical protein
MTTIHGPIPTLYDGDGVESAVHGAEDLLRLARPSFVQVHSWDTGRGADLVRAILPNVVLVAGYGVDGIARQVALGERSVEEGIRTFRNLAGRASSAGCVRVVWNAEGAWKRAPGSTEKKRLSDLVRGALARVKSDLPDLVQWHTAYDHPGYHTTYNWADWLGPGSPVEVSLPQVYADPGDGKVAARGALGKREAAALASWKAMVKAGVIRPDAPDGTPEDLTDCDWRPYLQIHSVPCGDTVREAVKYPFACLWAMPTRVDAEGRAAFLALAELERRGYWGEGAVLRFQTDAKAAGKYAGKLDNDCGEKTRKALGLAI